MARKDTLAAGARSANFAVGAVEIDAPVELKNVAPEGSFEEYVPAPETKKVIRKKFIPNEEVLLVRRTEAVTPSGILLADSAAKEAPAEGTVLEAGKGAQYSIGDYIVFGKYAGAEFTLNGEVLLLMDASEVKGRLIDDENTL